MKVVMRDDLAKEGANIPSTVLDNVYYSAEEIAKATIVSEDDEIGEVLVRLLDGRIISLYSSDLEFVDEWRMSDTYRRQLPTPVVEGLESYINRGTPVGHFLSGLLKDQLMETVNRADLENRQKLVTWLTCLYAEVPFNLRGNAIKVDAWIASRADRVVADKIISDFYKPKVDLRMFAVTSVEGVVAGIAEELKLTDAETDALYDVYKKSPQSSTLYQWLERKYGLGNVQVVLLDHTLKNDFVRYMVSVAISK